jgi:hypothetical protein
MNEWMNERTKHFGKQNVQIWRMGKKYDLIMFSFYRLV